MVIQTSRFGEVKVDASRLIELEEGLLGFPQERRYCLLQAKPGSPFHWLQSVERPELAFLVVGPHEFFPDYEVLLGDETARDMALEKPEEAAILTLVSIQEDRAVTANLVGPVVVNTRTGGAGRSCWTTTTTPPGIGCARLSSPAPRSAA